MLLLDRGFVCLHGRSAGAELLGLASGVLEDRAGVGVDQIAGLYPLEAVLLEEAGVLCFQQSAGNSAGPEVDVALALLGDGALDRDVG